MILYQIVLVFLAPVLTVLFALRWLRGKESRDGLAERRALGQSTGHAGSIVWVHGASLGELTAARPLMNAILAHDPAVEIVVTMNSYTARKMVQSWGNPRVHPRMAPLDYPQVLRRFASAWSPRALVVLENELWPNRFAVCRKLNIPVLIAGGRMSAGALSMWLRFTTLSKAVADAISYLAPLDDLAAERFMRFGLDRSRIGPPLLLKSTVALPEPDPAQLSALSGMFDRAQTVLAASTHEGEEALILRAFAAARSTRPGLRLILAPRHPDRAGAILRLIADQALSYQQRSTGELDETGADVLLADTLGEMALWYSLAGITLIGGTWVEKGGHTPFEPAQFGSALVHGPSVHNHASAFSALDRDHGAVKAVDEATLTAAILDLGHFQRRNGVTGKAEEILAPLRNEAASMMQFVDQLYRLARPK